MDKQGFDFKGNVTSNEMDSTLTELFHVINHQSLSTEDKRWLRRLMLINFGVCKKAAKEQGRLKRD